MMNLTVDTVATLTCSEGFALEGQSTRTCMENSPTDSIGVWSGTANCERMLLFF